MTAVRKIIGLVIIVILGLPILFGTIWFTGLTKASVSPEFISELPQEIVNEAPDVAEEIFEEAQDERVISDENTRAWFEAAEEADITPHKFMDDIGLLDWMEYELSESLEDIGEVLRGERRLRTVVIDLRPLKEIFYQEKIDLYLLKILEKLPSCDDEDNIAWLNIAEYGLNGKELPACNPDVKTAKEVLTTWRVDAIDDIEDEIEIFEDANFLPFGISRTITVFSFFTFIIPAIIILIGALIAATSPASFCRWSGLSVFIGGLPALIISFFAKRFTMWVLSFVPYSYSASWGSELSDLILEKMSWIPVRIVDHLFSPVIQVALIVCVVGIVIFALSYMLRDRQKR
ncbi:MAG: hypothetical protein ACOC5F_04320 [Candidatus Aminicenantaceae bacterium]